MKAALVIINGIQFPYFLAEHAIEQSKKNGEPIHALFLVSGEEMPEEYAFPSDIDLAQTLNDKEDSDTDSLVIVHRQRKILRSMAQSAGVECNTDLLINPSLEQIKEMAAGSSRLYIAPNYGDVRLRGLAYPSMQSVIDEAPCPVEVVEQSPNK